MTENHRAVVEPFILPHRMFDQGQPDSIERPLRTLVGKNARQVRVCEPVIVDVNHGLTNGKDGNRAQSINEPIGTITAGRRGKGVVEPCLVQYNGTATAQSVDEPMNTVTGKDRYALVTTESETYALDIRLRMLRPHELAAAMSLNNYILKGKMEDQVKQIGNAVPVQLAKALCSQVIA